MADQEIDYSTLPLTERVVHKVSYVLYLVIVGRLQLTYSTQNRFGKYA